MQFLAPGAIAEAIARDDAGGWLLLREPLAWVSVGACEVTGPIDQLPVSDLILTPEPIPLVTVTNPSESEAVDKRLGPAEGFDVVGTIAPGATETAIARDPDGLWVMTEPVGWIPVEGVEIDGEIEGLPTIPVGF